MANTSWTRADATPNPYLYNAGSELNEQAGWYETALRSYDPYLGRFNGVDPMADKYAGTTPFNYAFNSPAVLNDPTGAEPGQLIRTDDTPWEAPAYTRGKYQYYDNFAQWGAAHQWMQPYDGGFSSKGGGFRKHGISSWMLINAVIGANRLAQSMRMETGKTYTSGSSGAHNGSIGLTWNKYAIRATKKKWIKAGGDPNSLNPDTEYQYYLGAWEDRNGGRRRWRRGNFDRVYNGSAFDERGRELLGRWLNGSGEDLVVHNGIWGDYIRRNHLLSSQIAGYLMEEAATRTSSGRFWIDKHPEIQNGYQTGYEMLHGPHEFSISGTATVTDNGTLYNYTASWFDAIDPNFMYGDDAFYAGMANLFYSPKNYKPV